MAELKDLIGQVMHSVRKTANDEIVFTTMAHKKYKLHHYQDCCESVFIESIAGDLEDLVGAPILMAEEVDNKVTEEATKIANGGYEPESFTWTFYKFATIKGYVTIRWFGESNGYYSEDVYFSEVK